MPRWPGLLFLAVLSSGLMLSQAAAPALAVDNGAGQVPTLQETLEKGLLCRLPSEFAFVRRVVALVDDKTLSRKTVLQTFIWARRQSDEMPFPYFQFALKKQAKRGVQF